MSERKVRWTCEREIEGVPEFVMLGSDDLRKAQTLEDHSHPGCYEFVYIERGKAAWELAGTLHETRAGDLFHSRPDEIHRGGFEIIEPCKFWWIIVKAPRGDGWLRLLPEESDRFDRTLRTMPRVVHVGLLPSQPFRQLRRDILSDHEFRSVAVRQAILHLLLVFLQPLPGIQAVSEDLVRQFERLIDRMRAEPDWRPSVQAMADTSGVSVSHFHRTFQAYTGMSPMSYMERVRHKEACRLLADQAMPVTEIAHALGYASSQHFATVFKRYAGVSPTIWRERRRV